VNAERGMLQKPEEILSRLPPRARTEQLFDITVEGKAEDEGILTAI